MDYSQLVEDIKETSERFTIISGFADVYIDQYDNRVIKDLNYWILCGKANDEMIKESMIDYEPEVDKEGCYQFQVVLKYERPDYGDYGRIISGDYFEVVWSSFKLDHTFQQRERDIKLDVILDFPF